MWVSGILSAICYSMMSLTIAHYGGGVSASEFLLGRSLVGLVVLFPFFLKHKDGNSFSKIALARGVIGTVAILILFLMIQKVGAGTATAIHYTSPMFIAILGMIFLNEKMTGLGFSALLLVLLGVTLPVILKGGDISPRFLVLGVTGAALSGTSFFLLKRMTSTSPEVVIYWLFCLVQFSIQVPMSLLSSNSIFHIRFLTLSSSEIWPCLTVGALACAAQLLMNNSFKKLPATTAGILNLLSIPITILFDHFYFGRGYHSTQVLMVILIFSGVLILRFQTPKSSFIKS